MSHLGAGVDLLETCERKAAKDVRDNLGVVINEARYQGKCTIITLHGKLAAAIVPIAHLAGTPYPRHTSSG